MASRVLTLFLSLFCFGAGAEKFAGDVTVYGDKWEGHNCGYTALWGAYTSGKAQKYFAAINNDQWDSKMNCGRCAQLTCTSDECVRNGGKPTTVIITDRCPECVHGDIDLSNEAWKSVTGSHPSRLRIDWEFVECPAEFIANNVEVYIKDGSNRWWFALQPRNTLKQVMKMEIMPAGATDWIATKNPRENHIDSLYFLAEMGSGLPEGDFQLRLTASDGEEITGTFSSLRAQDTLVMPSQFGHSSEEPTEKPTNAPTAAPTEKPTHPPTEPPTEAPTEKPTHPPTEPPTDFPTEKPTNPPTPPPTGKPTPPPKENPTKPPANDGGCTLTVKHELTEKYGMFFLRLFLSIHDDWEGQNWRTEVAVKNGGAVFKSWNTLTRHDPERYIFFPKPGYDHFLRKGKQEISLVGRKVNVHEKAELVYGVVRFFDEDGYSKSCVFASPEEDRRHLRR